MSIHVKSFCAARTGARTKDVRCEKCGCDYHYQCIRRAEGGGSALMGIRGEDARLRAQDRAADRLYQSLTNCVDLVPCPDCGWFSSAMLTEFHRRKLPWLRRIGKAAVVIGSILFAWALVLILAEGNMHYVSADNKSLLTTGAGLVGAGAFLLLILRPMFQRRFTDLNAAYPSKPNPIHGEPLGYKGIAASEQDASGRDLAKTGLLPRPWSNTEDGWCGGQLLTVRMPQICSQCLCQTDAHVYVGYANIPLCPACLANLRRKIKLQGRAIMVGVVTISVALAYFFGNDDFRVGLMIGCGFLGLIAGAMGGAIIAEILNRPVRWRSFSREMNTIRLKFDNPTFMTAFINENCSTEEPKVAFKV
jgi:hypothetical protein